MKEGATNKLDAQSTKVLSFGQFRLVASERLVLKEGVPVELSARALDILIVLTARPSEVVSKKDLLAQVWPDMTVEEGSLRFHMARLRKALGDGIGDARYIVTAPGRGYSFVAPLTRSSAPSTGDRDHTNLVRASLPGSVIGIIGRADEIFLISKELTEERFITIVGAGGIGKTTVAIAVGHNLAAGFDNAVVFIDVGTISKSDLVAASLASILGLVVEADDALSDVVAFLRKRRMLLILDTCEHQLEMAAVVASTIFAAAPQIHILATSREPLSADGEHVRRLDALACPPDDPKLTLAAAGTFPAAELFLERVAAAGASPSLSDADAATIAAICCKLDGIPLAIELAATRVDAFGLSQTAGLLNQHLSLQWPGRRTASQRQRSLQATLDWSYGLLSRQERLILRRLAVFVGYFTIEAALEVATGTPVDQRGLLSAIDSLVGKSMVAAEPFGGMKRYRLLDTTRAYILDLEIDDAGLSEVAARHAEYHRRWLEQFNSAWPIFFSTVSDRAHILAGLGNVRAALDWSFGSKGDTRTGIQLASAAAPVFLAVSLLTECRNWSERALQSLDSGTRGGEEEMRLRVAWGMSLMLTQANSDEAGESLDRSLAIAEKNGDSACQLRLIAPLHMFCLRSGNFNAALNLAQRGAALSELVQDQEVRGIAHFLLGMSLHFAGNLSRARAELELAVLRLPHSRRMRTINLGFEGENLAGAGLARTLWLQGHADQAAELARRTVKEAARYEHPVIVSVSLMWAMSVFHWLGDLGAAEEVTQRFVEHADCYSLGPHRASGRGMQGMLALSRGNVEEAVEHLQNCLDALRAARYEFLSTSFRLSLSQGLAASNRFVEALALINDTIRRVELKGNLFYMSELLRVKGVFLQSMPHPDGGSAETCFMRSLELSRRQGARSWELRTAMDLAKLLTARGQPETALALLQPIFGWFKEGLDAPDLLSAKRLLAPLNGEETRGTTARPRQSL
jgi:predicted ATPase/DNA-binding winged helix-turn-helix (wHTH) protein